MRWWAWLLIILGAALVAYLVLPILLLTVIAAKMPAGAFAGHPPDVRGT